MRIFCGPETASALAEHIKLECLLYMRDIELQVSASASYYTEKSIKLA